MGNSNTKQHYETAQKTGLLSLSHKSLNEVPSKLKEFNMSLRTLDLSYNKIQVLPPFIFSFTNLKIFNMDENRLRSIQEEISNLKKLENLSVKGNKLTALPNSISLLHNLKEIYLDCNDLVDFPVTLCDLKHLHIISLSNNKIQEIPPDVGKMRVSEMNLNDNEISVISKDISRISKLKILRLENNRLTISSIPKELLTDSNVSLLSVTGNMFDMKTFVHVEGYDKYIERYTETKKKMY